MICRGGDGVSMVRSGRRFGVCGVDDGMMGWWDPSRDSSVQGCLTARGRELTYIGTILAA